MTNEQYQTETHKTNIYSHDRMLDSLVHGISSEAGEIAGHVTKCYRGDKTDSGLKLLLIAEIGDLLWFISELCNHLDYPLGDVMDYNVHKLRKRMERGTINGSGDER